MPTDFWIDWLLRLPQHFQPLPLQERTRDEFGVRLRSFPIESYIAFYRVRDEVVEIVRIIHGARDLGAIFGD